MNMNEQELLLIAVIALAVVTVALFITTIVLLVKISGLNKKYMAFMNGSEGRDLESTILTRFKEIDALKSETSYISKKLNSACDTLLTAYQKVGIVKYDAFKEMGGKLSFSLCLLDDKDNGFVMTSMHTREGCYTYIKEIIRGEAYVILASEERRALDEAKSKKNFMGE